LDVYFSDWLQPISAPSHFVAVRLAANGNNLHRRRRPQHSDAVAVCTAPAGRGPRITRQHGPGRGTLRLCPGWSCTSSARLLRTLRRCLAAAAIALPLAVHSAPAAPAAAGQDNTAAAQPAPHALKAWTEGALPAFALPDLQNRTRLLQDFAGKTVLVHFFATWCEPCVREIESLQTLAAATRGQPLAIVAVDVAEVDLRVRAFFDKHRADFPVLLDRDRAVAKAWQVSMLPTTFVLDAGLVPRLFVEGDLDWTQPAVRSALDSLSPAGARNNAAHHSKINPTEETAQ
jgi:thiol-disulfide isomerase/thioredoxin